MNHARILILGLVLLAAGCRNEQSPSRLMLSGSSTIAPLMGEVAKRFEAQNPGVRVDVQMGGTSRGISDARQGLVDIGMASRELTAAEGNVEAHTLALDGICLIVHQSNPVASLTDAQIASIFRGQLIRWSELGGRDAPIVVVNKAEGRSTLELFLHHFKLKNSEIKAQVVIGDNQQGIKMVASNPEAIGYVSVGAAELAVKQGEPLKLLPMNGVAASLENLRNGTFPLRRTLNLITRKGPPNELARRLIRFAQSPDVNDLIERQYFVPLER